MSGAHIRPDDIVRRKNAAKLVLGKVRSVGHEVAVVTWSDDPRPRFVELSELVLVEEAKPPTPPKDHDPGSDENAGHGGYNWSGLR